MKRRYQIEEWKRNRERILALLTSAPLTYGEVRRLTMLSDAVLSAHLKSLMNDQLISKIIRKDDGKIAYTLTDSGIKALRKIIEAKAEPEIKAKDLQDEAYERFRRSGFAATIQKTRGLLEAIAIIPVLSDLISILKPGKLEDEYLSFASKIYVGTVKSFLGRNRANLRYIDIRAAWQVIDLSAWQQRIDTPCLIFDYPSCWNKCSQEISGRLKNHLEELIGDEENQRWRIFRRLKLWSFPLAERLRLIKEIPLNPQKDFPSVNRGNKISKHTQENDEVNEDP